MTRQKKYEVFISYSRKDSAVADKICSAFDKVGITYFIDRKTMGGTANYIKKIANEIDNSKVMLLLASTNAYNSKYVAIELHYAFDHDVIVQPYALDDVKPPKDFEILLINTNWHHINADPIIPDLLTSISQLAGKDITNEITEITEPEEQPITPELTSRTEQDIAVLESTSTVKPTAEQESTRTSDSAPTPKHTNKSWIWILIAASAVIGLGIFASHQYRLHSTSPIREVEESHIDSIQYSQIQDSITKPSKTDTTITTSKETQTNTKEQTAELIPELVNKTPNKIEEKTSLPKDQSKSPIEIESTYNEVIPSIEMDSQTLEQAWETLPDTLIEGGIIYRKDAELKGLAVIGMAVDTTSFVTATIPESIIFNKASFPVKHIAILAFSNCKFLKSITIPNSVTEIGWLVFWRCESLTSITIPNSVTSIGLGVFSDCSSLTSIYWNANTYNKSSRGFNPFNDICSQITTFEIGEQVTHIPSYICYSMRSLTSIKIPNSVTCIGEGAFWHCSSLTSVTISNCVTSIGEKAFWACASLKTIVFEGTKDQWQAISKGGYWNHYVPAKVVHCTDGDVEL